MNLQAKWIGKCKGEINSWPSTGSTAAHRDDLKGKIRIQERSLLFRKEVTLKRHIENAMIKICGLGYYELHINGKKPDENRVLTPIYSDYFKKTVFDVYDVKSLIKYGINCLCIELGGGWFCPPEKWWSWRQAWHGTPRMIATLVIVYSDGSTEYIVSDESWRIAEGGVIKSCIYDGETYDANAEPKGWLDTGFNDNKWPFAVEVEAPTTNLIQCVAPPVRVIRKNSPIGVTKLSKTQYVFDFGENAAALPFISVCGKKGEYIILNHAEYVNNDGTINTTTNGLALAEDKYIFSGQGIEKYRPRFTWHGFRYMMVTLSSENIMLLNVESHIIHSDIKHTGYFECSSDDLNKLHAMFVRTNLACLLGVPVDCPQRDERLPWLGDAYAASESCLYNFDMQKLCENFLEDMRIGREPKTGAVQHIAPRCQEESTTIDWNMAYPVILNEYYDRYGDKALLAHHYEDLKAHVAYYTSIAENGLIAGCYFGDWFTLDRLSGMPARAFCTTPVGDNQNPPYNASMFFFRTLKLTARISSILHKREDEEHYNNLAEITRRALISTEYNRESGLFGYGGQFAFAYSLHAGIIYPEDCGKVFGNLLKEFDKHNGHNFMGVLGTRCIFDLFIEEKRPDLAYKLLVKEGYPGLLNMMTDNRTTLTEAWDGGGSGCHCMFASPDAMFYKLLGGITINRNHDIPVVISPYVPNDIEYVICEQELAEGKLVSTWLKENGFVSYHVEVPEGLSARFKRCRDTNFEVLTTGKYNFKEDNYDS